MIKLKLKDSDNRLIVDRNMGLNLHPMYDEEKGPRGDLKNSIRRELNISKNKSVISDHK